MDEFLVNNSFFAIFSQRRLIGDNFPRQERSSSSRDREQADIDIILYVYVFHHVMIFRFFSIGVEGVFV